MFRRLVVLAVALSMGTLTAACTGPAQPTPTSTPSPTFACIPEAGGDPVPCGPIEYEQAQKRDKLYAEAEAVYRRYWAELSRISLLENPSFTDELASTTTGAFQEGARNIVDPSRHRRQTSGEVSLVRVSRLPGLSRSGSTVALLICTDASNANFLAPGDVIPVAGKKYETRAYLIPIDGSLRLVDGELREVSSC